MILGMTSSRSGKSGPGRPVTWLPDVTYRRLASLRLLVENVPCSGEPNGPWQKKYFNYIGMLAKMKVSIVIAS